MTELIEKLANRSMTAGELFQTVEKDWTLLPQLLQGVSLSKAAIRYGCSRVLMDLSEAHPTKLYPFLDPIIDLLDSKYRIITWNALTMIANLARVDAEKKVDAVFDKYYSFLNNEYMVTVANVVAGSGKIALAKPYLVDKITNELLKVDNVSLTPHLTEECKRVIAEKTIETFDVFFDKITQKSRVISFATKHTSSSRKTLRVTAKNFLKKWVK
jgi:hypothetical protein